MSPCQSPSIICKCRRSYESSVLQKPLDRTTSRLLPSQFFLLHAVALIDAFVAVVVCKEVVVEKICNTILPFSETYRGPRLEKNLDESTRLGFSYCVVLAFRWTRKTPEVPVGCGACECDHTTNQEEPEKYAATL